MRFLGWLLGLDGATSIEEIDPSLSAPWAVNSPFWLFFGLICVIGLAFAFYLRWQRRGPRRMRIALALLRGSLLALLLITLANPVLKVSLTNQQSPLLYLVFDGTDSMAIRDEYAHDELKKIKTSLGMASDDPSENELSRLDCIKALLRKSEANVITRLSTEKGFRLAPFLFDGNNTSRLRKLESDSGGSEQIEDPTHLADQLTTNGQVTAIGSVLDDVSHQFGAGNLAGVVLISDFANNSGAAPLGGVQGQSPASRLGVPIYTVGVGATETVDLAVDIQTDPKMKRAEKTSVMVKLRQGGLLDQSVLVRASARRLSGSAIGAEIPVGDRIVSLSSSQQTIDFPFTPEDAGRFEFIAEVEPLPGEVVSENNRASREVNIIDDYLRLMYVAYEPTWEWRFVKEVFHRDKLVGMDGFRTYLASSDPQVRETNILFMPTLTPQRSEFFANDVIFLGDMPRKAVSDRFCDMVKEFVSDFGGGLVVIAGPRFGLREMAETPLADMLPVIIDPDSRLEDEREFRMRFTAHTDRYPFMQIGDNEVENAKGWDNLGPLPWYQPVAQLHEQAYALAVHPTATCRDGKTPQPLIAIRKYGAGEVVYLGHNEMWRLRRKYGDRYYRRFWSQLIYRLGMSHALGADKRFVVRTDRQQYRAEDYVTLTIEAYDQDFEPLSADDLPDRTLTAELSAPGDGSDQIRDLAVPQLRTGVFEARIPVYASGEYSIRVKDPITAESTEVRFSVTDLSAERRRGVRDAGLQQALASATSGRSYDLTTVNQLPDDLHFEPITESYTRNHPLWSTPFWFGLIVLLMLGEWFIRKMINLA